MGMVVASLQVTDCPKYVSSVTCCELSILDSGLAELCYIAALGRCSSCRTRLATDKDSSVGEHLLGRASVLWDTVRHIAARAASEAAPARIWTNLLSSCSIDESYSPQHERSGCQAGCSEWAP
jgi:hypothetical protein